MIYPPRVAQGLIQRVKVPLIANTTNASNCWLFANIGKCLHEHAEALLEDNLLIIDSA